MYSPSLPLINNNSYITGIFIRIVEVLKEVPQYSLKM